MYWKTRKIMTMNKIYHPHCDTDRLYNPRTEGGRGLLRAADCVETKERTDSSSILRSIGGKRHSKSERILPEYEGPVSTAKKQKKEERHKQWREKQLHRKFVREADVRSEETWGWIGKGYLKKETEGLIFAAQHQAL